MGLFSKKVSWVTIDIGTSSVKMVVLEGSPKKMKTVFENEYKFHISKNEEPEEERKILIDAIKKCAANLNRKKYNRVIFSIPAQNVIARVINMEAVPLSKLDNVIGFEAEQHIPFPIAEVAYNYQLISYNEEKMEILIAAVKQERLDELLDIITSAGFESDYIDVTCFALYNLYCYQNGLIDFKSKKYQPIKKSIDDEEETSAETTVLLDVGSGTADISILKNGVLYFTRSALIAGDNFTEAIQKKYNISYDQAEKIKKEFFEIDLESAFDNTPAANVPKGNIFGILGKPKPFGKPEAADAEKKTEPSVSMNKPGLGVPKPSGLSGKPEISKPVPPAPGKPSIGVPKPGGLPGKPEISKPVPPSSGKPTIGVPKPGGLPGKPEISKPVPPAPGKPGLGVPKPGLLGKPQKPDEANFLNDENKTKSSGPKLLGGAVQKTEEKSVIKPSLLKPNLTGKKLLGSSSPNNSNEEESKSTPKFNIPKPPGKSLGAAAAETEEEPKVKKDKFDYNSIDKKELFSTLRPMLDRLVTELRRSFDYYKTQLNGDDVDKIILTGGSSKLNGLDKYLSKRLGKPIEIFVPNKDLSTQSINENSHEFSVALGLGLRNVIQVFPINELNFIPADITLRRVKAKQKKNLIFLGIVVALGLLIFSAKKYFEYQNLSAEKEYVENLYNKTYKNIIKELDTAKAKKKQFQMIKDIIKKIQENKAKWLDVMSELSNILNDKAPNGMNVRNIWINDINFNKKESVNIEGYTKTYAMINSFINALKDSKHFVIIDKEKPVSTQQKINEKEFVNFKLKVNLKHFVEEDTGVVKSK